MQFRTGDTATSGTSHHLQRTAARQNQGRLGRPDYRMHLRRPDRVQIQRHDDPGIHPHPVAGTLHQMVVREYAGALRRRIYGLNVRRGLRPPGHRRPGGFARRSLRQCRLRLVARQPGRTLQHPQRHPPARVGALAQQPPCRRPRLPDRSRFRGAHVPGHAQRGLGVLRPRGTHHELRRRLVRRSLRGSDVFAFVRLGRHRVHRRGSLENHPRTEPLSPVHERRHRLAQAVSRRLETHVVRMRKEMEFGYRLPRRGIRAVQHRRRDQQRLHPHRPALRRGRFLEDARHRHPLRTGLGLQPGIGRRYPGRNARVQQNPRKMDAQPARSGRYGVRLYRHLAQPHLQDELRPGIGSNPPQRRFRR